MVKGYVLPKHSYIHIKWFLELTTFTSFYPLQCHNEVYKLGINEFDIFLGSKMDVKNPVPTRYPPQSDLFLSRFYLLLVPAGTASGSRPPGGRTSAATCVLTTRKICSAS